MVPAGHSTPRPPAIRDPHVGGDSSATRSGLSRHVAGLTALSATAAFAITLSISTTGELRFAVLAPSANAALETAAGLVAALAAFLAYGRFRITGLASDFALLIALSLLAATTLLFFTGPAVTGTTIGRLSVWARALGTALAAFAFVAAAFSSPAASRVSRRRLTRAVAAYGTVALALLVVLVVIRPAVDVPREPPAEALSRPLLVGTPLLLAIHVVAASLFAAATFGFIRRCRERGDGLTLALALAMPLACGTSLHYLLFPSRYPDYVFTGDVFRLSFFAVILIGVLAQIGSYVRLGERLGMLRERERLARDLHDGPVQELALLGMLIDQLARRVQDPVLSELDGRLAVALAEWREVVADGGSRAGSLPERLERAVRTLVAGTGIEVEVEVEVDPNLVLSPSAREDVLGLVREAVSNAARHAQPSQIRVVVSGMPLLVVIADDGQGVESRSPYAGQGYGMRSMRDRAAALGGELTVQSSPAGTELRIRARR
jgi:signal transduction histidine kinase